jgi:hypothetical protein
LLLLLLDFVLLTHLPIGKYLVCGNTRNIRNVCLFLLLLNRVTIFREYPLSDRVVIKKSALNSFLFDNFHQTVLFSFYQLVSSRLKYRLSQFHCRIVLRLLSRVMVFYKALIELHNLPFRCWLLLLDESIEVFFDVIFYCDADGDLWTPFGGVFLLDQVWESHLNFSEGCFTDFGLAFRHIHVENITCLSLCMEWMETSVNMLSSILFLIKMSGFLLWWEGAGFESRLSIVMMRTYSIFLILSWNLLIIMQRGIWKILGTSLWNFPPNIWIVQNYSIVFPELCEFEW